MSQIDTEENIMSETTEGQDENVKLVPVAESIRYRKRAQSAEKKVETLAAALAEAQREAAKTAERLNNIAVEQKLMRKLAAAGTVDMEAAVLVGQARMEGKTEADLDGVIEQLQKEKQYLFGGRGCSALAAKKTAGVRERGTNNQTVLEKAAKKAATTGSRTDLQEYLKLRRNLI